MLFKSISILFLILPQYYCQFTAYYDKLNIKNSANTKEIRRAFKKLVVSLHPDKNRNDPQADEKFREISDIYEILKDEETRKIYDRFGEEGIKEHKDKAEGRNQNQGRRSYQFYQNEGLYDDDDEIVTFDSSEFDFVERGNDIWFINFYSTMCSHCHTLAPTWRLLAKQLYGTVNIGAVNCMDQGYLCNRMRLSGYPSLILFYRNNNYKYQGDRSLDHMNEWLFSRIQSNARVNNIPNFQFVKSLLATKSSNIMINVCSSDSDCISSENEKKLAAAFNTFSNFYSLDCDRLEIDCEEIFGFSSGIYTFNPDLEKPVKVDTKELMDIHSIVKLLTPKVVMKIGGLKENEGIFDISEENPEEMKVIIATCKLSLKLAAEHEILVELRKITKFLPSAGQSNSQSYRVIHINCEDPKYKSDCQKFSNFNKFVQVLFVKKGQYNLYLGTEFRPAEVALAAKDATRVSTWLQQLDHTNFDQIVLGELLGENADKFVAENWFLDFYSPTCPPCRSFMKTLRETAENWRATNNRKVNLASIDCSLGMNNRICNMFNVRQWPTGIFIKATDLENRNGQPINSNLWSEFNEDHSFEGIEDFIRDIFDPPIVKLDQENFKNLIQKRPIGQAWLVKFGTNWCGPCRQVEQQMKILARNLLEKEIDNIRIGVVDCDEHESFCSNRHFVEAYPTIKSFPAKWDSGANSQFDTFPRNSRRGYLQLGNWISNVAGGNNENADISYDYRNLRSALDNMKPKTLYLIDFYANWCQPCLEFKPIFASLNLEWETSLYKKFYSEKGFKVEFVAFDCAGTHKNQFLCQQENVPHYPYIEFRWKAVNSNFVSKQVFKKDSYNYMEDMLRGIVKLVESMGGGRYVESYDGGESVKDEL